MHTIQVLVLRDNRTKRKQRVMIMIRWSAALLAGASVMPRACWHMGYVFWRKKKKKKVFFILRLIPNTKLKFSKKFLVPILQISVVLL